MCYGRWDTSQHKIEDVEQQYFPGQDYNNPYIEDFKNVSKYNVTYLNRHTQPRMPWHDVSVMLIGTPVKDICYHFIQYWNFVKVDINKKAKKFLNLRTH